MTDLDKLVASIMEGVPSAMSNLANAAAVIYNESNDLNWAGFYILEDGKLRLGPFQGRPACTEIAAGKGVCGTAARLDETVLVRDVHEFPGHIACDSASASEIVIPLHLDGKIWGVLDIDSPLKGRFSEEDKLVLERTAAVIELMLDRCRPETGQGLSADAYQELAMRTLNPSLSPKDVLINSVMGLCGESGEAIDIVKKWLSQGHELDKEHLTRELGDVAWYLAEGATALGLSLSGVLQANIDKLKARYPEGFSSSDSLNRDDKDI